MYLKDPQEVDAVTLERLISDVPIMMLDITRNMTSKFMVGTSFVLFVTTVILHDNGS